jgi:mono/diheme cytochrome c family protein
LLTRTTLLIAGFGIVSAVLMSPAQDPATVALGKKVFEGKAGGAICFSCHGMNAKGAPGLGPDLTDDKWLHGDGSLAFLDSIVRAGVSKPKHSAAVMPPMGGAKLSDEQVKAVVAYIQSRRKA